MGRNRVVAGLVSVALGLVSPALLLAAPLTVPTAQAALAAPTLLSAPSGTVGSAHAAVGFSAPGAASVQCRVDAAAWTLCDQQYAHHADGLSTGPHTFDVRAVDDTGQPGAATTVSWTVSDDQQTITWVDRPTGIVGVRAV